jgi:hypothetical protein
MLRIYGAGDLAEQTEEESESKFTRTHDAILALQT